MDGFYQSAFLEALGWSLVDSLWQMGLLWICYIFFTGNGKWLTAPRRHTLAVLALFGGFAWFIADIFLNYYLVTVPGTLYSEIEASLVPITLAPYLSASYLLMIAIIFVRWLRLYRGSNRLQRNGITGNAAHFEQLIAELKLLSGSARQITLRFSENIYTPLTTGFIKPVILFPLAAVNQLSLQQVEALIVHEFFHIRRNDYLINLCTSIIDIVLFFNPFSKLLQRFIQKERENCCDDEVLSLGYDKWEYAQALYIIGRAENQPASFAIAATGQGKNLLLERIERMMNRQSHTPGILRPFLVFGCAVLLSLLTGPIPPQIDNDTPSSAFRVAGFENSGGNPPPGVLTDQQTITSVRIVVDAPSPVTPTGAKENQAMATEPSIPISHAVIRREAATVEKKSLTVKITPLVLPEPPCAPEEPAVYEEEVLDSEDVFIARYVSSFAGSRDYSFIPASVADFQLPQSADPLEPFIPNATFYFPTHEVLDCEDGKTIIKL